MTPAGIKQALFPGAAGKIEKSALEERARPISAPAGDESMHPEQIVAGSVVWWTARFGPAPPQPAAKRTLQITATAVAVARTT